MNTFDVLYLGVLGTIAVGGFVAIAALIICAMRRSVDPTPKPPPPLIHAPPSYYEFIRRTRERAHSTKA